MAEHFCVNFGDPSCIGFWDNSAEKQTNAGENPAPSTAVVMGNLKIIRCVY